MDELVQWLGEQLDAETVRARATAEEYGSVWTVDDGMESVRSDTGADVLAEPGTPRAFIAEHDPARVLREIDADRKLLAEYVVVAATDVDEVEYAHGWANALGLAVRIRAAAFSDRPGYREEWRP